jgi:hypothetical protein
MQIPITPRYVNVARLLEEADDAAADVMSAVYNLIAGLRALDVEGVPAKARSTASALAERLLDFDLSEIDDLKAECGDKDND